MAILPKRYRITEQLQGEQRDARIKMDEVGYDVRDVGVGKVLITESVEGCLVLEREATTQRGAVRVLD